MTHLRPKVLVIHVKRNVSAGSSEGCPRERQHTHTSAAAAATTTSRAIYVDPTT